MSEVFIIKQNWSPEGTELELEEVYENRYYKTFADAQSELLSIAADHRAELDESFFSFDVPTPARGIQSEFYYIESLWSE